MDFPNYVWHLYRLHSFSVNALISSDNLVSIGIEIKVIAEKELLMSYVKWKCDYNSNVI